jgi:predicted ArsR family transcriptional regulator
MACAVQRRVGCRLKLAIASNTGFKPMTKDDRKRIAEYLYGTKEWTMEKIAEALDVGKTTIERDLANLPTPGKLKPAKTASNPKGAGRPKGSSGKKAKPESKPNKGGPQEDLRITTKSMLGITEDYIAAAEDDTVLPRSAGNG